MKKAIPIMMALTFLANVEIAQAQSGWQGPADSFSPPQGFELVGSGTGFSVELDEGQVIMVSKDNDPKWLSCNPDTIEQGHLFDVKGVDDVVPWTQTQCPNDPPDNEWRWRQFSFEGGTISFSNREDSGNGFVYFKPKHEPEKFEFQFHLETSCQENTFTLVWDRLDARDRIERFMVKIDGVDYHDLDNITGSWGDKTRIFVWVHIWWDNGQHQWSDKFHHKPDCLPATYALTVSGDCNGGLATGHADTPAVLEITGTGADGQSVSISQQVGPGDFNVTIDWENPGTFGPHGISLTGTLTADHEVVADDSFDEDVTCGEATYSLSLSGNCNGGLASGHTDTAALLEITGTGADGEPVNASVQVGSGNFNVPIDWENPGTFGPHGISLSGTLEVSEDVVTDDSFDEDVTCGEPPPPPPGGFCRSFKIVKHGQTDEVRFKGDGLGVEWRVVRTSDGKVMAEGSGNHAEGSFVDHSDSSYKLQFRGEDGNWSEGCISDPTELCAACEGPQWEVMVGENSSDEDEKGGRGIVFSKGPCTICPESLTAQVDSWYYYDGHQPITMYYQGEYYDTTMHVGADGVEYNMLEIDLLGNDHNYICLRYGVRSIANLSEEDRCAREYINKYVSCSVSPGWQDTTEDGMGHFRDGQQEADWVTWLLNEGFFPRTYEGAADAYVWANELGANGTNALPERTASADSNSNVSNVLVELEELTT